MAPKKKGKGGKGGKGKGKEDDAELHLAHVKAFIKAYGSSSQGCGTDPLALPFAPVTGGGEGTQAFGRIVVHPQVCSVPITAAHVRAITDALTTSSYTHLLTLALWNVNVGDEGTAHVANWIATNRTAHVCELADCGVGAAGCKALGEALERNATLTRLSLEHNAIGDAGVEALSASIRFNRALTSASLGYCGLSPEGAPHVANSLLRLGTLTSLELRGNALGPTGVVQILQMVVSHAALTYVGLGDTGFGVEPEVHAALLPCVQKNTVCHSYDLRGNPIGDSHAYTYTKLIKKEATHVISFQVTEKIDPPLFKQLLDATGANKKEWLKKRKKKKGGKKGGKKKK